MPSFAGGAIRLFATFLYALEFCCAGIIIGVYSYFLAVLSNRNLNISRDDKAVEGLSGVAVVYTIFAVILTCFLGGISFFAFLAILLNVCFCGAFIAIAILTRGATQSCSGIVTTPIGNGPSGSYSGYGSSGFGTGSGETVTYSVSLGLACRLNKAVFAVAIIGAILFALSALVQIFITRNHQKEKRYGPSPANNYTSGSGKRRFWQRKNRDTANGFNKDAEMAPAAGAGGAYGGATLASDSSAPYNAAPNAPASYNTNTYTTTAAPAPATYDGTHQQYGVAQSADHGGYSTGPVGNSVNPYSSNF